MSNFMNNGAGAAKSNDKTNATSKKKRVDDGLTAAERRKKRIAAAEARLQALIAKDKEAEVKEASKTYVPLGRATYKTLSEINALNADNKDAIEGAKMLIVLGSALLKYMSRTDDKGRQATYNAFKSIGAVDTEKACEHMLAHFSVQ